ncbi:hypothetical protein [Mycobacterium sp. SMC-14]|uniref:hypothetical protein n=1 Tax=Mycobacterium sp. SMC-14 TaxID=3385968 RepID=UPI00390C9F39
MALAVTAVSASLVFSPFAAADPECSSYELGKQSVDDAARQGPLHVTDLPRYCDTLLAWELKSGRVARVESRSDFIAGCDDEGRVLIAGQ